MTHPLRYNETIILVLLLSTISLVALAWYLKRSCGRVIDVQVHEMQYQRDMEAQRAVASGNGNLNAQ
jgi:cell division protein FtsB